MSGGSGYLGRAERGGRIGPQPGGSREKVTAGGPSEDLV